MTLNYSAFIFFIQKHWLTITLLLLATIAFLSLWPAPQLPDVPGSDKSHHFIAYATLIFPVALRKPKHYLLVILALVFFSGMIELIQPFVNRYGEWLDMAANTSGLICGWLLANLVLYFTAKPKLG